MLVRQLYCLLFIPAIGFSQLQDTVPQILYFNENFEKKEIGLSKYYGFIEQLERKHFKATLYNQQKLKIATLEYSGRELSLRNGWAVGYHLNGNTQFMAYFNKNVLEGSWISYYDNGLICDSGMLTKSIPDGRWVSYYEDGMVRTVAEFNAKKMLQTREEMRRMYRPIPGSSFGGLGPDAIRSSIYPLRGQQAYLRAQYLQMQESIQPTDIVGKSAGLSLKKKIDQNTLHFSQRYMPPFDECLVHGQYKSFFPDGKLKDSGYFNNGLKSGVWQESSDDRKISSRGFYKKGTKRGDWRFYSPEGKFLYLRKYTWQGRVKETIMLRH